MSALDAAEDTRDERIRDLEARLQRAEAELEEARRKIPPDVEQVAKEARKRFLRFILDKVNPGAQERHHGDFKSWSRPLWQEAGRLGLIGFNAPKEIGGEGRDVATWSLTLEELGKLTEDPGFLILIMINNNWARLMHALERADLVERYARPMIRGDLSLSWAIWEQADPGFMQSVARKVEGGWVLSGHKPIVVGGMYAGVFGVVVREEESSEPTLFLVEKEDPGVQVAPLATVGGHHQGFASLTMKDVQVKDDRLMVDSDALGVTSRVFNDGILNGMAVHLGWMQRMFGLCVDALRTKVRAGQAMLDIPHVQSELGRLHMGIEAARSIFLRAVEKYRLGTADPIAEPLTAIFKHFVVERGLDTARTVMTLQGATGYMDEQPWGRFLTHEVGMLLAAGAQDLLPQQVGARMLMELEMKRLRRVGF